MIIAIRARIRANRSRSGVLDLDPEDRRSFSSVLLDFPKTRRLPKWKLWVVRGHLTSCKALLLGLLFCSFSNYIGDGAFRPHTTKRDHGMYVTPPDSNSLAESIGSYGAIELLRGLIICWWMKQLQSLFIPFPSPLAPHPSRTLISSVNEQPKRAQ